MSKTKSCLWTECVPHQVHTLKSQPSMGWYLEVRPPQGHWVRRVEPSWWDSFPYRGTPGVPIVAAALFLFFQTCLSSWVSDYQNLEGDYTWRQGHQSGAEAFGGEETRRSLPLPSLRPHLCTLHYPTRSQRARLAFLGTEHGGRMETASGGAHSASSIPTFSRS